MRLNETRIKKLAERMKSLKQELLTAPRYRLGTQWWMDRAEAIEIWRAVIRREREGLQ